MSTSSQYVRFTVGVSGTFETPRTAMAKIDTKLCINCGTCRRACPTEAITEYQRVICRYCPDCAAGPQFYLDQSQDFAREHACSIACPLGTVPEGYLAKISEGKFEEAYALIAELNPLPGVCGRICNHPCMDECKRGLLIDKAVNIRGLKRFVTDTVTPKIKPFIRKHAAEVAVIGAGPAGLMAAFDLARKGYGVTIFEAGPKPGGMMNIGIPAFRLDKAALRAEIAALEEAGIKIRYNTRIGKNPTIDALFKAPYAAVILAVGASKGLILPIEGSTADTVYDAVSLMTRINSDIPQNATATNRLIDYGKVVIIGGGSVALDTARALLRKGAVSATCVCIEDDKTMPAMPEEIEDARQEGVQFTTSSAPTRIITAWTAVKGVEFAKVSEITCDACGRLKPVTCPGTEFTLEADSVVFATGQKPDLRFIAEGAGLKLNAAGLLDCDPGTLMAERRGLFLAGDAVTGRGSVIEALASGRRAALSVDNLLQGRELTQRIAHTLTTADSREKIFPVMLERLSPQEMPVIKDRRGFDEIEQGYTAKQAMTEAQRCMKCGFEAVDVSHCIGCGMCAELCPRNAITLVAPTAKEVK